MSSTTSVWWLLFIMGRLTVYLILSLLRSRCCTIAWKLQSFSTSTSLSKRTHKKTFLTLMLWYENNKAASVLSFQIFNLLQVWITVSRKQKTNNKNRRHHLLACTVLWKRLQSSLFSLYFAIKSEEINWKVSKHTCNYCIWSKNFIYTIPAWNSTLRIKNNIIQHSLSSLRQTFL